MVRRWKGSRVFVESWSFRGYPNARGGRWQEIPNDFLWLQGFDSRLLGNTSHSACLSYLHMYLEDYGNAWSEFWAATSCSSVTIYARGDQWTAVRWVKNKWWKDENCKFWRRVAAVTYHPRPDMIRGSSLVKSLAGFRLVLVLQEVPDCSWRSPPSNFKRRRLESRRLIKKTPKHIHCTTRGGIYCSWHS